MKTYLIIFLLLLSNLGYSQVDENELGAWYMLFWNTKFGESQWGAQGDIQHRNWNLGGDLEQLLLRGGITYNPKNTDVKLTLGYGHINTGAPGSSTDKTYESRIYQEALLPQKIGNTVYLTHRFRYEQRFVDNQDFRTRYRYNLFLNIPLNNTKIEHKTIYIALYNELFINGQRGIGDMRTVEIFDRNRFYSGLGYALKPNTKIQLAVMKQTTNAWAKQQLQLSVHTKF